MDLKGKTVVLALTGGIAAYKIATLASMLVKQKATVLVLMTENATRFIAPLTFEALTGTRCMVDTFDRSFSFEIEHVAVADRADLVLVAPASANVIAKMANGIADDMLTTTVLACRCPKLVAPAMNTGMYENPATQANLARLREYGVEVIDPACGRLACGAVGPGKMPEPQKLLEHIQRHLACQKDMAGLHLLVTAGPTREALDPVRFITNHSTGRMGYELARAAMLRGAQVTLVSGPTALEPPPFVELVRVESAQQMHDAVMAAAPAQDVIIKAAAVADYRPAHTAGEKIKKSGADLTLELTRTPDILAELGAARRPGQFLCGFAMETRDLLDNARAKLENKGADMIVANSLREAGAGFGGATNHVTLVEPTGCTELPLAGKDEVAHRILDRILARRAGA
ncbi:bifunctional phosphopantothenoylcysteine decarboxylase/phosphopantothenate--cysteine ligase CoaBC [Gemmiger formicilis]|uniref:bifunctional phosphopantothenoylcysteine decarboxylase/phosphopantothenate--cysteine ligase CoaBC n=1 Tax=Gemmiger formicilis TaxID=745368 RepID=UPI00195DE155|nr:bifunctional phosphopantothenoylcysteine decarboxylase/phosphopantothenate--cysteine ligase CoaBC [Gemmiger formicilis]MBM6916260.1 bifunctional phosphopantothenoylcysteine decarboxylase/phosphopantothenate--cysteine ligase CoaBC [Gemmiger formicilis]